MNSNFATYIPQQTGRYSKAIKSFMKERGFSEVVLKNTYRNFQVLINNDRRKNLEILPVSKSIKGWTGIFEDGGQNAEKNWHNIFLKY